MPETPVNITPRQEGCEAVPIVKGTNFSLPACMGGTALVGCNNPDQCTALYYERVHDPTVVSIIFRTDDNSRVRGITTVSRRLTEDNPTS